MQWWLAPPQNLQIWHTPRDGPLPEFCRHGPGHSPGGGGVLSLLYKERTIKEKSQPPLGHKHCHRQRHAHCPRVLWGTTYAAAWEAIIVIDRQLQQNNGSFKSSSCCFLTRIFDLYLFVYNKGLKIMFLTHRPELCVCFFPTSNTKRYMLHYLSPLSLTPYLGISIKFLRWWGW